MKQLLNKSLVLVVMLTTMVSYSNVSSIIVGDNDSKATNVTFEDVKEGSLLLLKDSNGHVLYKELVEKTGTYNKDFDLTSLPDANYYFELDNQIEIKIIPFTIKATIAVFVEDGEYKIVKPKITVENHIVYVSKMLSEKQSLEIEVYFEGYDLAYSEKFKEAYSMSRVYDFSSSQKGNYTIIVKSEGRVFKNIVNI